MATAPVFNTTDIYVRAGYHATRLREVGSAMRFIGITIPQGSTIDSATITFRAAITRSTTVVNTRFRCQAADNAATFSTLADFDARTWTTTRVDWDAIPTWTADQDYASPDLKTIIQEVIDRAGWVSGNALVFLWDDWEKRSTQTDETLRYGQSYDSANPEKPILQVNYTSGGSPGNIGSIAVASSADDCVRDTAYILPKVFMIV